MKRLISCVFGDKEEKYNAVRSVTKLWNNFQAQDEHEKSHYSRTEVL